MTSSLSAFRHNPLQSFRVLGSTALALVFLAGCDETGQFSLPQSDTAPSTAGTTKSTKLVERDVEAPEVFSVNDEGLWDGRPSLGGVWVAHPDVSDPERVIVRNEGNGKFVVGALFRKERNLPGPRLQVSSDAAAALGILAGAPAKLNVTALRREETEEPVEIEDEVVEVVEAPTDVDTASLDPIAAASAAIDAAPETTAPAAAAASTAAILPEAAVEIPDPLVPEPAEETVAEVPAKPFIQIGIFSAEKNANRAARRMTRAGLVPTVKTSEVNGQPFWRVVVGPASSAEEFDTLSGSIKAQGFSDAYAVAN